MWKTAEDREWAAAAESVSFTDLTSTFRWWDLNNFIINKED